MRSKCSKLKWNQGSLASGFTVNFWSIEEQTMENCCRFVFYNNIDSFDDIYVEVSIKTARGRKRTTNCATITSFPWSVLLSNKAPNQPAPEESLIYCKNWLIDSRPSDFLSPNQYLHKKKNNYIPFSSCVSNQYVARVSCC